MVTYADTGFIVSLYLPQEQTSIEAQRILRRIKLPLILTPLTLLEIRNALNFSLNRGQMSLQIRNAVWAEVEQQISDGFFKFFAPDSTAHYLLAQRLSDKYTPNMATRSLDLLHVAAALLIEATFFLSFDERQLKAAKAEGLNVFGKK
jgi:predicted nucleic acid-binding protein